MRWPTRLEILLTRAAGARRTEGVAGFGTGTLSIIGSATGTLIVIIGCRVTRWSPPAYAWALATRQDVVMRGVAE
jgi:hypothetical protein